MAGTWTTNGKRKTFKTTLTTGQTETVYINDCTGGTITVEPTAATASVEWTIDTFDEIEALTATWFDWAKGDVTSNDYDTFGLLNAIKLTSTGGTTIFKIVCTRDN